MATGGTDNSVKVKVRKSDRHSSPTRKVLTNNLTEALLNLLSTIENPPSAHFEVDGPDKLRNQIMAVKNAKTAYCSAS